MPGTNIYAWDPDAGVWVEVAVNSDGELVIAVA